VLTKQFQVKTQMNNIVTITTKQPVESQWFSICHREGIKWFLQCRL